MIRTFNFCLLIIFLVFSNTVTAQHFEWVERYTGGESTGNDQTNIIFQSVVDSEGNIYFTGKCSVNSGFHGNKFLPITPHGSFWNTSSGVIGKMSPDGELLWSKVLHGNNSYDDSNRCENKEGRATNNDVYP